MQLPIIHNNGSSASSLLKDPMTALDAVREARVALGRS